MGLALRPEVGGIATMPSLGEREFAFLRDLVMREAGIHLNDQKRSLVEGRLARRLRHHALRSYREYVDLLKERDSDGKELLEFINCITTNKTSFFREQHHFDFLRDEVIARDPGHALRIWSAACSTGEEPYSIAMTVRAANATAAIMASDIDTRVLATARDGLYPAERTAAIDREQLRASFLRGAGSNAGWLKVRPELQRMIDFRRINLVDGSWPSTDRFDVIFCRNVVIYFNRETQERLFRRFAERLVPGGFLILGHSENLNWLGDLFEPVGKTIYRVRGARAAARSERSAILKPAPRRAAASHTVVRIEAGGLHVSKVGAEVRTVLGSCVSACLFDPVARIGGMNHFMLPDGHHATRPARYGVHAMELLINEIMKAGGDRTRLRAKVFGGASVIAALRSSVDVGRQNSDFIRAFLSAERIPVDAELLAGLNPLEVRFHTESGRVRVRALNTELLGQVSREEARRARRSLDMPAVSQDVEAILF